MNVTNCIWQYENVPELELKAHVGSSKCTKSLFCIFLNSGLLNNALVTELRKPKTTRNYLIIPGR